jgi:hypothetical protein
LSIPAAVGIEAIKNAKISGSQRERSICKICRF